MTNIADELTVMGLKLLGKLPLPVVHRLGAIAGRIMAALPTDAKRVTGINIDLCFPDQSPEWRQRLVKNSVMETVVTGFEMGPTWTAPPEQSLARVLSVEGEELLQASRAKGKGVVLLAPHLGNWEVVNFYIASRYPLGVMYQPGEMPKLSALILAARRQFGNVPVPTDTSGVKALLKHLKKGNVIGILPDQKPDRASGVMAPFFGVEALTQTLGPRLTQQTGADVYGLVCYRDRANSGYRIRIFVVDPQIHNPDLRVACSAMNRSIEQWVRLAPEQYQWEYKRFGRRPTPLPDVYKKRPPA